MNRTVAVTALTLASLAGVAFGQDAAKVPIVPPDRAVQQELERGAAAQVEASRAAASRAAQAAAAKANAVPPTLVTIDFPGGTVTEYVEHVKRATKTPINVVVSPSVGGAVLAGVQLKEVPVDAAIAAIQTASGQGAYSWRIRPMEGLTGGGVVPNAFGVDGERRGSQFSGGDPGRLPRSVDVIALPTGEGGTVKPDVALAAIEAGLRVSQSKGAQPAEVSYHKESGLLFVNGTPEHIELVRQVLIAFKSRSNEAESAPWLAAVLKARTTLGASNPPEMLSKLEMLTKQATELARAEQEAKATAVGMQSVADSLKHQLEQERSIASADRKNIEIRSQAEVAEMKSQFRTLEQRYRELLDQNAALQAKLAAKEQAK
ncbi:MAG: hypothetical protein AABZ53_13810 [Planctomycetota bacterium]